MLSSLEKFLTERSGLTEKQVETLKLHKLVSTGEISPKTAAKQRASNGPDGVKLGAYYRVLRQATANIEQSVYTLLLCDRLGLLKGDEVRRLLDLLRKTPQDVDDQLAEQVVAVLQPLIEKLVTL